MLLPRRAMLAAAAAALGGPARGQPRSNVLRFVPASMPGSPDPLQANPVARSQSHMIWDMLYGLTTAGVPSPQMVAGHEMSADGLVWRFTLRAGLRFHDGTPVRARDCIASIRRWGQRRVMGEQLLRRQAEMRPLDDLRFELRLHEPFPPMLYALASDLCFVLPERLALQAPGAKLAEVIGSGPFRYLGAPDGLPAFARFIDYVPAPGAADFTAGGKVVRFDRVEWIAPAEPPVTLAALQQGAVDWWHDPLVDVLPVLRDSPGLRVSLADPTGAIPMLFFNHLQPPFNNARLRRAVLLAVDQDEFLQAAMGSEPELTRSGVGIFTPGMPFANDVGMEVLTSPRDLDLVRRLVVESGYRGEPVVLLGPSDIPRIQALSQVANDLFERIGLKVEYTSLEWSALLQRRASKEPVEAGGWSAFCTTYSGLATASPGTHMPIAGAGTEAGTGWPGSKRMESLRDAWFDAPDLAGEQTICRAIQRVAWEEVPYIPLGQWFTATATVARLSPVPRAPFPIFWGIGRD